LLVVRHTPPPPPARSAGKIYCGDMPQRFTPQHLLAQLADRTGVPAEQVKAVLQAQAELAYEHAPDGFPIPGLGVFVIGEEPERRMTLQFGRRKGETVVIPAKPKLTFRVTRIAKDVVLRHEVERPNVFEVEWYPPDPPEQ
jgi:nucleoid DNA-binding protein